MGSISVWPETATLAFLLVVVLVLEKAWEIEDENDNEDDSKIRVSGQAQISSFLKTIRWMPDSGMDGRN